MFEGSFHTYPPLFFFRICTTCVSVLLLQWALFLAAAEGSKRGDDFLKVTQLQVASMAPIPAAHMDGAPPVCPAVSHSTGGMLTTLPGRQHYRLILQTKKLRHREVKAFAQSHTAPSFLPSDHTPSTLRWNR